MQLRSSLDRLNISKRTSILTGAAIAIVIFITLTFLYNTYARSLPLVIDESFTSSADADDFDTTGAGMWQIVDGVYRLMSSSQASSSSVSNVNASLHKTSVTAGEWRLEVTAKVLSSSPSHDFSLIFDYVDEANYYYVNFSAEKGDGRNGIFKIQNGNQTQLIALPITIETDKQYDFEIRKDNSEIKVYRDKTYLAKTEGVSPASMRIGFGSNGGSADFDNLTLGAAGVVTSPTPTPAP
ncbi:MAG: hypothetical protein ACSLEY_02115 [Candidatus Saccharimonadales bacterium]